MKKYLLYFLTALFTMTLLPSCEDMLEEESNGVMTMDEFLEADPDNIIYMIGQMYADVKWLHDHWGYWGISSLSSDECVVPVRVPGSHWNDNGYWKNLNTMDWTPEDESFESMWNGSATGAAGCNLSLSLVEGAKESMTTEAYQQYKAEVIVMRAYYYYTMFDCFGRIPYSKSAESASITANELPTVSETWSSLVRDLKDNADYLPLASNPSKIMNYGRVTQGFAYGLLARLYLNAESFGITTGPGGVDSDLAADQDDLYTKCVTYCDKVIDSDVYSVEANFFNNFAIKNDYSNENMFVIVENGNGLVDSRSLGNMSNKLRVVMLTMHYMHQETWDLREKPWNGFCATPSFIDLYSTDDTRGLCDANLVDGGTDADRRGWFVGPVFDPETGEILQDENNVDVVIRKEINSLDAAEWNDGARSWKYEVEEGTRSDNGNRYCDNDFVLMRYAEILYTKAEAILRGGVGDINTVLNDPDFQMIRTRANQTIYAALDLEEIRDERGREFSWEMLRRRDLIRYNQFVLGSWWEKPAKDASQLYRRWFPIPTKVLETAPIWTQNEGY